MAVRWTPPRCWVGLHDPLREVGLGELYLRCRHCHKRTGGWSIETKPLVFVKPDVKPPMIQGIDWASGPDRSVVHVIPFQYPHDLELAAILADLDEQQKGRRVH